MLTRSQKKSVKRLRRKRIKFLHNCRNVKFTFTETTSAPLTKYMRIWGALLTGNGTGVNHPELDLDKGGQHSPELLDAMIKSIKAKSAEQLKESGFVDFPPMWEGSSVPNDTALTITDRHKTKSPIEIIEFSGVYEPGIAAARHAAFYTPQNPLPTPEEWSSTLHKMLDLQLSQMSSDVDRHNPHLVTAEQIGCTGDGIKILTQEQYDVASTTSTRGKE